MGEKDYEFYANAVNVLTSVYDVTLSFRVQSPVVIEQGKAPVIQASEICNVRMSPQHAKALAAILLKHVIQYEKEHNINLPLPEDVRQIWDEFQKRTVKMFNSTCLDVQSFTWESLLAKAVIDFTTEDSGCIMRDFIGEPEEYRDLVARVYGKYAGFNSLTKALLAEKAIEKLREDHKPLNR